MAEIFTNAFGRAQQLSRTNRRLRQTNELAELLQPYQVQDAQMGRAAKEARFFISALGADFDPTAEGSGDRWRQAVQSLGAAGGDVSGISEIFDPNAYEAIKGIASQVDDRTGQRVQSSKVFGNGTTLTIMRDNTRVITDAAGTVLEGEEAVTAIKDAAQFDIDKAAGKARSVEEAKADVKRKTEPEIQKAIAVAKTEAEMDERQMAAAQDIDDLRGSLDRLREFTEQGIYMGSIGDKFVKSLASGGIVFDQEKLNRTTRVQQIATNLKFMAKPAGMGAMSDSEWGIIRDAIPDPETATAGQLIAGLEEFEKRLEERAGVAGEPQGIADLSNASTEDLINAL